MAPALVVPHDLRVGEEVALILGFGLSTLAVMMRMWTKARLMRTMLLEDYLSLCAWLSFLAYIGLAIVIGSNGGDAVHKAYLSLVESTIYCPIIVLVKASILLQYVTFFVVHRGDLFHILVQVLLWTNVVFYTIDTFLVIFECSPRAKAWDDSIPGSCFSLHQLGVYSGVINLVSDFAILLLPMLKIWRLQMPWARKWRILAVFAVGLLGCIAAILRLSYSVQLTEFTADASPTQQLVTDKKGLWGFAEIALGIIAGCIPVLPRFFHQSLFIKLSHGSWSGRSKSNNSGGRGGSSEKSGRTLRKRLFGAPLSLGRRYLTPNSSKLSGGSSSNGKKSISTGTGASDGSTKKSVGRSFHGIETQNLTRPSMDIDMERGLGAEFGAAHLRNESSSPSISLTALPQLPGEKGLGYLHRQGQDKSLPDLPGGAEQGKDISMNARHDKDLRWQEMSRMEAAKPAGG